VFWHSTKAELRDWRAIVIAGTRAAYDIAHPAMTAAQQAYEVTK
jgi:hypothetical protein